MTNIECDGLGGTVWRVQRREDGLGIFVQIYSCCTIKQKNRWKYFITFSNSLSICIIMVTHKFGTHIYICIHISETFSHLFSHVQIQIFYCTYAWK